MAKFLVYAGLVLSVAYLGAAIWFMFAFLHGFNPVFFVGSLCPLIGAWWFGAAFYFEAKTEIGIYRIVQKYSKD